MSNNDLNIEMEMLFAKKANGTINTNEEAILNDYLIKNSEAEINLEAYQFIWEKSAEIKIKQQLTADQRWKKLESRINKNAKPNKYRKLVVRSLSVAASIIFCFTIYTLSEKEVDFSAPKGKIVRCTLPDKSEVILNSESTLHYSQNFFSNKRLVTLEGEAFFKVEKNGKEFIARSEYAEVTVLGTQFNVKNRNSIVRVSCIEGSVKVINKSIPKSSVVLSKGYATTLDNSSIPVAPFNMNQIEANGWTKGIVAFNQTPIIEVLNELMRTYNITISTEKINPRITYNGEFNKKEITEILETIAISIDMKLVTVHSASFRFE